MVIDFLLLLLGEVPVPVLVRKTVCSEQVYRGLLGFLEANALPESQNELRSLFSIVFSIQNSQTFSQAFLTTHAADKPGLSRLKSRTKKLKGLPNFLKKINKKIYFQSLRKKNQTLRWRCIFCCFMFIFCVNYSSCT